MRAADATPLQSAELDVWQELGLTERDFDEITAQAQAQPYANPRPVTAQALRFLLTQALKGTLA
ncbi:hypothetical protein ACWDDN_37835 [Streptomyces griseoruber]|uniref:Uncharacterized protein n=1 Tax=Streptomyces griseoruber TaxID=1943 RepID=A0A101T9B9_9ACTN|nr:hypothetical protein AQJ64_04095 [Streptomyces griseoruber]